MARTATKSAAENIVDVAEMIEEEEEKVTKKTVKAEALNDSDEIEVVALIPNVSYKDSKTLDMYEWDLAGHTEYMSFETLKNMWRSHKGYFKNMWLKPNDDRVINKFGLTKTFEKYEYLMEPSNYTKKNIGKICDSITSTPNGLKIALCDKIKDMVVNGEVSDVSVIRALENRLNIDLIEFL